MKNILSILSSINLIGTGTIATILVTCNSTQYNEDELKKEKEKII